MSASEQLLGLIDEDDPFSHSADEIVPLQVEAARERLNERRAEIPVLDQRARDVGIDTVKALDDLIPLLFSHTTYKSYPETFVKKGQWDRLLQWYGTLTAAPVDNVDLSGVTDIDEWMGRLWAAGHFAYPTSGTSGKCSFLPSVQADRVLNQRIHGVQVLWPRAERPGRDRRWYQLTPRRGFQKTIDSYGLMAEIFARPDAIRCLTDEPMLVSELNRVASMRKAIGDGSATPGDIAAFERDVAARATAMTAAVEAMAQDIVEHREEPMVVAGLWAQHWTILQIARSMGVEEGKFHPETIIMGAGGTKGAALPPDYQQQIYGFYGDTIRPRIYGMSELIAGFPRCEADRYHRPPWITLLVLDQAGELLLNADHGKVQGRAAFFDVAQQARWGGLVTGDRISVDFDTCACGRPGPTVEDNVVRYAELEGSDDKLTCAGTMEAYVRGVIEP